MNKSLVEKIKQIFVETYKKMNKEQDLRLAQDKSGFFPYHFMADRLNEIETSVLKILERCETTNMVLIEQLNEVIREQKQKLQHFKKWVESLVVADQFSKSARLAKLNEKFELLFDVESMKPTKKET